MRLLFLTNVFPNPVEPAKGRFNLSMVQALRQYHKVRVVSPVSWTVEAAARFKGRQIAKRRDAEWDGTPVDYPRYWYPPKLCRSCYGAFLWWSIRHRLLAVARELRPHAVLSYWTHPDGEAAVRLQDCLEIPAVTMVGGSDVLLLGRKGGRRRATRNVLQRASAVVAVSRDIARTIVADGIAGEKVHVVYRGIDSQVFQPGGRPAARQRLGLPAGQHVIVAAGRLVGVKGLPHLISACRMLRDKGVDFACYCLGDGPDCDSLRKQIERCGLSERFRLQGSCRQHELAEWYRAADLIALPSLSEGVPNVLLESMSCGTPFVASRVGGVAEIADPLHDRLVPPGDPQALAAAIADRLKTPRSNSPRVFLPATREESASRLAKIIEATIEQRATHCERFSDEPGHAATQEFAAADLSTIADGGPAEALVPDRRSAGF